MFKYFLIFLAAATLVSGQAYPPTELDVAEPSLITSISSLIVNWISRLFQYFMEALEIKVRIFNFLSSLYTEDNLTLVKRFVNVGLRFGGWVYDIIPDSPSEGISTFLRAILPQKDLIDVPAYDEVTENKSANLEMPEYSNNKQEETGNDINDIAQEIYSLDKLINSARDREY